MRWITSDTHFYHKNIIRYANRPFKDVKEMNNEIIRRWNSVVGKNDIVYHLGDFSFGNRRQKIEILSKLNGRIILLKGNHDRGKSNKWWKDLGFDEVFDSILVIDNYILSHEPLYIEGVLSLNVGVDMWNFYPIPFPTTNQPINLCGHVHEKWIWKVK